jgi:hypothetical protein
MWYMLRDQRRPDPLLTLKHVEILFLRSTRSANAGENMRFGFLTKREFVTGLDHFDLLQTLIN